MVSMQQMYYGTLSMKRDTSLYLFSCTISENGSSKPELIFEVEVCKVWLLNLHGVKIKRVLGPALKFKEV